MTLGWPWDDLGLTLQTLDWPCWPWTNFSDDWPFWPWNDHTDLQITFLLNIFNHFNLDLCWSCWSCRLFVTLVDPCDIRAVSPPCNVSQSVWSELLHLLLLCIPWFSLFCISSPLGLLTLILWELLLLPPFLISSTKCLGHKGGKLALVTKCLGHKGEKLSLVTEYLGHKEEKISCVTKCLGHKGEKWLVIQCFSSFHIIKVACLSLLVKIPKNWSKMLFSKLWLKTIYTELKNLYRVPFK